MSAPVELPKWADVVLIPVLNIAVAFIVSGLVVLAIGEDPVSATRLLITGSLGSLNGLGYTLYYATSFIFTGLAVAVAFKAGLFNIGGEGQAYVAGLGWQMHRRRWHASSSVCGPPTSFWHSTCVR